jgi:hypothetical protein
MPNPAFSTVISDKRVPSLDSETLVNSILFPFRFEQRDEARADCGEYREAAGANWERLRAAQSKHAHARCPKSTQPIYPERSNCVSLDFDMLKYPGQTEFGGCND